MMIEGQIAMYTFIGGVGIGAITWQMFQMMFMNEIRKGMCKKCSKLI